MSSANSSSNSTVGLAKQRGIPRSCNCGEVVSCFTSRTVRNPGRLFHCCPMGSEKDKSHLFKWTDKSVVEEIEDFQELFDVLLGETMLKRHESRIYEMEDSIARCQEKTIKCISELRMIKALFLSCLVMVFMYITNA
ncbi:hypothetical protein Bca4012_037743 [Brassica carinata]